ncbi:DUF6018 family natural product bioysynthesis protein [Pontibacillus halophilus]|uniref:DUF6018 family natural product bioysynthesis protein n=1 Tax=Pontibacillus halophilus TaxID=516704 RepID=UPI00047C3C2A|nr:DUF6018 family natural product bioysynthesis protein [Pontibacillus halophilus]
MSTLTKRDIHIKGEGALHKRRKFVEVRIPSTGAVEQFDCRTRDDKRALKRALMFVEAAERRHGEKVYWNFRGENTFHISTDLGICRTWQEKCSKMKDALISYFFDID